ncbi:MAG: hypothetical protein HRT66_10920 [Flavobacteriaceae bacterium]|nr:hypothetical protein [Flavobacteriaceae bacterium]
MISFKKTFANNWFSITILFILCLSFYNRYLSFTQTEYANGWDSYFYLVQLKSFIEQGYMHSEEWTIMYPFLYVFVKIFGYVKGLKIAAAFISSLFILSISKLTYSVSKHKLITILIASWFCFSTELSYFAAQWLKNLLGIVVFIFLWNYLIKKDNKYIIIFFILSLFSHRSIAILSIVLMFLWYINLKFKHLLIASTLLLVVLVLLNIIPGMLNIYDIDRLSGMFNYNISVAPHSFIKLLKPENISFLWTSELYFSYFIWIITSLFVIYKFIKNKKISKLELTLLALGLILIFPFYKLNLNGVPYRLYHISILLLPISILVFNYSKNNTHKWLFILPSLFLLIGSVVSWKGYQPSKHDPDYHKYEIIVSGITNHINNNNKIELIISHKSLAEFISFKTNIDAMSWIPEYEIDSDKLYRVAYFTIDKLLEYYMEGKYIHLYGSYYFILEDDWNEFVKLIKTNDPGFIDLIENNKNPMKMRPMFLM